MGAASTWAGAFRPTGRSLPQSTHHVRQSKIAIGLEHSPPDSAAPISAARSPALSSRRTSADGIGRTIEWVRDCVSEVVVIDCGSSHAAVEIAQRLGQDSCSPLDGLGAAEALWKGMLLLRLCPISMLTRVAMPELREIDPCVVCLREPPLPPYRLRIVEVYPRRTLPRPFEVCLSRGASLRSA